jgi:predicted nucleotidyltransferase
MATEILTKDYKEFLKLLNSHKVKYLLIGGYAVGYHGYVRATADIDIWIPIDEPTAEEMVKIIREFGFTVEELKKELFLERENVIQMGNPPFRIDILTSISGVEFSECYPKRIIDIVDGVEVSIIDLESLRKSKAATGRGKDKIDLDYLPK